MSAGEGFAYASFWIGLFSLGVCALWLKHRSPRHKHKWVKVSECALIRTFDNAKIGTKITCQCDACGEFKSFEC